MMNTAISLLSVVPMRKEPSHRSEMVSQLLFGECAEILEEEERFVRVKCLYDDYEGWVQANQLTNADTIVSSQRYLSSWSEEILVNGISTRVPMCSPVYFSGGKTFDFGKAEVEYLQVNESTYWDSSKMKFTKPLLESVYQKFLNTPYLWGGKSVFGIDCSGFVQQVFKMFGVKLLRDAYLQAEQGTLIERIAQTKLGDLAFFHNDKGRIIHVGIILENNQIVHASGKVRIDTIDEKGIVNSETGERTHELHSMRRYF
jgi:hypothetical protein